MTTIWSKKLENKNLRNNSHKECHNLKLTNKSNADLFRDLFVSLAHYA